MPSEPITCPTVETVSAATSTAPRRRRLYTNGRSSSATTTRSMGVSNCSRCGGPHGVADVLVAGSNAVAKTDVRAVDDDHTLTMRSCRHDEFRGIGSEHERTGPELRN